MGYIDRNDFLALRDNPTYTPEDFRRHNHAIQMQRIRKRREELERNPQPTLGVDFSVFNLCKIIYTRLRDEKYFKLFIPEFSNFKSFEAINSYVIDNPNSLLVISYDLAKQISLLRLDDSHRIELSPNTLNQWKQNSNLKSIVRDVSVRFHYKLNEHPLQEFLASSRPNLTLGL